MNRGLIFGIVAMAAVVVASNILVQFFYVFSGGEII